MVVAGFFFFVAIFFVGWTDGFLPTKNLHCHASKKASMDRTLRHVAVDPRSERGQNRQADFVPSKRRRSPKRSFAFSANGSCNHRRQQHQHHNKDRRRRDRGPAGLRSAAVIESRFVSSLESLRLALSKQENDSTSMLIDSTRYFPTVRECNEALAAFGDAGDLLRALRLFGKMRKLAYFQQRLQQRTQQKWILPVPSLVTYSTLMSRAVKQHKPRVALRLWNLMVDQENVTSSSRPIQPDVKAANILMNCYAKLADVPRAKQLLEDMKMGQILNTGTSSRQNDNNIRLTPNLVTMNTMLNACQKAGDLDAALVCQTEMETLGISPDARTFTTLISTVARGNSQWSGKNDPTLAFTFLQQMKDQGISPNGMTYSALIDVCGRCRRSDLALQGLRMMLRQKAQESKYLSSSLQQSRFTHKDRDDTANKYTLPNEVGAWTAAIDACGKSDRLETATKLFYAMDSSFGCKPNTVTCGCLTDSLLRAGRTAETLNVLRYMKRHGMEPTEVMYTSLMTQAEQLVQMENNNNQWSSASSETIEEDLETVDDGSSQTKAIEVYTELMRSLIDTKPASKGFQKSRNDAESNNQHLRNKKQNHCSESLVKVFLVFQQMKASGATPDIACYNALLRACARAGEWDHALRILKELQSLEHLEPNDTSWRELLRAASRLQRSDLALKAWGLGLAYRRPGTPRGRASTALEEPGSRWIPSIISFSELISAFSKEAFRQDQDPEKTANLLKHIIKFYRAILKRGSDNEHSSDEVEMGMALLKVKELHDNRRAMLLILKAAVFLRDYYHGESTMQGRSMQQLSTFIVKLPSFASVRERRLNWSSYQALEKAESWIKPPDQNQWKLRA